MILEEEEEDYRARKRYRCHASHSDASQIRCGYELPAKPASTPLLRSPCTPEIPDALPLDSLQHAQTWTERAYSIATWSNNVTESRSRSEPCDSSIDDAQVRDTISAARDVRARQRRGASSSRSRTSSPTKKGEQYRNTILKPTNIFIDLVHDLPREIESLLPYGLRDALDPPPSSTHPHAEMDTTTQEEGSNEEKNNATFRELVDKVPSLAALYRDECRELAKKPGSKLEYRTQLYVTLVQLTRIPPCCGILSANCNDKLWNPLLKPRAPRPILLALSTWPTLSPNSTNAKEPQETLLVPTQESFDSNVIPVRYDSVPFPSDPPEPSESSTTEPSESSNASSRQEGTLTTPKPDITVGISREAFNSNHASLLDLWQNSGDVLSDPHATQGDMLFPFLIVEAKGLSTSGNLIGAQNQAAGAGTCAVRLLESLAAKAPNVDAPRTVYTVTTEGAMKELWITYWLVDEEDNRKKYYMTCLGAWRTTIGHHYEQFVMAKALICVWGVNVFFPMVKKILDSAWNSMVASQ